MSQRSLETVGITYRQARAEDGRQFPLLIEQIGTLERNTEYCDLLMAKMFHRSYAVVEQHGQ